MKIIIFVRQLIATLLYVIFDVVSPILQFILVTTPIVLGYVVTEFFDLSKDIKILTFISGFILMIFVYDFLKKHGKKLDLLVREKTKKCILWIGGKDFLVK